MRTEIQTYTFIDPSTGEERQSKKIISYEDNRAVYEEELIPVTAEKWLELQNFTALQILALTRLEQSLVSSGGQLGVKMAALRDWLQDIMLSSVTSSEPKTDWTSAPYSFEEAAQEATTQAI